MYIHKERIDLDNDRKRIEQDMAGFFYEPRVKGYIRFPDHDDDKRRYFTKSKLNYVHPRYGEYT